MFPLWMCVYAVCVFPTRQLLRQVHVPVLLGEMHPLIGRAQQTPGGEDGYCGVCVLAAGRMLLDEDQVTHHHRLGLRLQEEGQSEARETTLRQINEEKH